MSFSELFPCPCCGLPTIDAQGQNDVCPECGWEDDGQDDADADVVRGGPNGARSLTEARAVYQEAVAQSPDNPDSFAAGEAQAGLLCGYLRRYCDIRIMAAAHAAGVGYDDCPQGWASGTAGRDEQQR